MNLRKILFSATVTLLLVSAAGSAIAGDFGWTGDFNIRAEADLSGFRARLTARFPVGDAQIGAVLGSAASPADAYIILRLGEMSSKPPDYVLERYKVEKGKGWGVLAKSLGIKPGSREFHALKRGNDLYSDASTGKGKGHGKGKGKGKL